MAQTVDCCSDCYNALGKGSVPADAPVQAADK